jgi:hypothetical protein
MKTILCAAVITALAGTAGADPLIGNINAGATTSLGTIITGSEGRSKAVGFTMGAQSLDLLNVQLRLDFDTAPTPGGIAQVAIWGGASNPTSLLTTLSIVGPNAGVGIFDFVAGSTFTLDANTTYWVMVNGAPGNTAGFYWNVETPATTPTGDAAFVGYRFSASVTPPTASSSVFNAFQVNVVPAPGAMALLGLGGLAAARRRRA